MPGAVVGVQGPGQVQGTACRGVRVSLRGLLPALRRKLVPVRAIGVAGEMVLGEPVAETQNLSVNREHLPALAVTAGRMALPVC